MDKARRSFLKGVACAGASIAGSALPAVASQEKPKAPEDAVGMLYDTTLCIGCKTCVVACHEANGLKPDNRANALYDAPTDLNERTKNIIKLYKDDNQRSYVERQCMHCIDPSCATACMIGSLQKREHGIVTWDPNRCIGCRYCQMACPYHIPKFEWSQTAPKIIKCEMCNHLIAEGKEPACCEVCPRGAVIYGTHKELLATAKKRLADHPGKYVPKIYGEHDNGGTQVLYLSHIDFEKLDLPDLGDKSTGSLNKEVQHGIYKGMIAPVALYAVLGGVMLRNRKTGSKDAGGES